MKLSPFIKIKLLKFTGLVMIGISFGLIVVWIMPTSDSWSGHNWTRQPIEDWNNNTKSFMKTGYFYPIESHSYFYALAGQHFELYSENGTFSMELRSIPLSEYSKDNYGTSSHFKHVNYTMQDTGLHYYQITGDGDVLSPVVMIQTHEPVDMLYMYIIIGLLGFLVHQHSVVKHLIMIIEKYRKENKDNFEKTKLEEKTEEAI